MGRVVRPRRGAVLVAMVLVLGALPFDATPSLAAKRVARSSWPLGVSEAPRAPVATRSGRAVVALGSDRVFVFGGGKMGEGVSKPDGHDDGAILTLATKRWSRTARAPFKVVGPGGVWTGRKVIVVGGAPRCTIDNPGFRQCRTAVTKAGVYDPATDSWHEFNVPAAFKRFLGASPLMWTGKEALFLQGQEILALSPSGRFRAIDIPSTVAVGWTCATKNAIATMDSHVARDPAAAVTQLQIYDPRTDRWTASSPSPGDTGAGLLCTSTSVIPVPNALATSLGTVRYDVETREWSQVAPVTLPGFTQCTTTSPYGSCDIPRWSGQGRFVDAWLVGKGSDAARRYDPSTNTWSPIAAGPDIQPLGEPGEIVWAGSLAATYATANGPGSGSGERLLVYRPGPI